MQVHKNIEQALSQLSDLLDEITQVEYNYPIPLLTSVSIGQNVRHIIEMFNCLFSGYEAGFVNYEKRKRDNRIETDKVIAKFMLLEIQQVIKWENRTLLLVSIDNEGLNETVFIETNYQRELMYNLEHTVHHMALIKVGVCAISDDIHLPEGFGVSKSNMEPGKPC